MSPGLLRRHFKGVYCLYHQGYERRYPSTVKVHRTTSVQLTLNSSPYIAKLVTVYCKVLDVLRNVLYIIYVKVCAWMYTCMYY
jgi:hypothetical protein